MAEQNEAVFVAGLYLGRVPDAAPSFVITNQTIHVEKLIEWLQANKNLADEKGYIRLQGKESKNVDDKGFLKRYFQVDFYKKPEPKPENVLPEYPATDINPEDIPF